MKKNINLLFAFIIAYSSLGQNTDLTELQSNYPDSLVLSLENQKEMVFLFNRMSRKKEYFSSDLWKSVLGVMETAIARSDIQEGIRVQYEVSSNDEAVITITELEPVKSVFIIKNDGMKEQLSDRIEFLVIQPQVAVSFAVGNGLELDDFKELNIESVWTEVEKKYENEGKVNLYKGTGDVKYGEVSVAEIKDFKLRLDNLEITFLGLGLGYYRDRFIPDLGSKLAFKMYNRLGKDWIDFGFLYTQQYINRNTEDGDFKIDLNGWLTTYFKIHVPGDNEFGIGIGGLIHSRGDFYQNRTLKLSLYTGRSNSRFSYSPELIFTDNFNKLFPAMRIGLSF